MVTGSSIALFVYRRSPSMITLESNELGSPGNPGNPHFHALNIVANRSRRIAWRYFVIHLVSSVEYWQNAVVFQRGWYAAQTAAGQREFAGLPQSTPVDYPHLYPRGTTSQK